MTEHLDVLVVGAGLTGIGAGAYLQNECPWASYAIFEARASMGGTWDLFRYPGIRSDSDMFTLGYKFRPWDGAKTIADGPEILQYIKDTARETGVGEKIRYHHKIVTADWSSEDARWTITAERSDPDQPGFVETFELTCSFLFSCSGYYRYDRGYTPDFPGLDEFTGPVVHPQHWPEDMDFSGKRVVVIGSGATAVTLVPNLAKVAGHVTMLQRSPTYVISRPAKDPALKLVRRMPGGRGGELVRWIMALGTQATYFVSQRWPERVKAFIRKETIKQLPEGFDVDTHFKPRYNPWDERLCVVPDGDLFKAIKAGTADVVTDHIETITPTGIRLVSGKELEADVIVTATGLDVLFLGGIDLIVDGEKVDVSERMVYKGMMVEDVPNLAIGLGYANASWTLKADLTCGYVTRLLNKMRSEGTKQATPRGNHAKASEKGVFGLQSGYLQRAADRMPKQGTGFPWQVHQSYVRDFLDIKRKPIDDGYMTFSSPPATKTTTISGAAR